MKTFIVQTLVIAKVKADTAQDAAEALAYSLGFDNPQDERTKAAQLRDQNIEFTKLSTTVR